ncbi:TPA: XRE family transcriptional regulator [Escherichia coli]|nr:XRE family transcriptional regulator [Escherichia coli]HCP8113490.1 XRE family transcriptional regulator [Escherichia coli]HCP8697560.1 XRE family transcriptional regulator [Escherichia coli]HCP8721567.1 XRE family transcriptional regulator [Escherichia coli]HCP8803556.1 XRE family transcriptional regulator [Escherichia coli]
MSDNKIEFIESRYAAFIAGLIESSPMSQAQIAKTIGYKNANNLSLIKSGKIPLPIDKVRPLALALGIEPSRLMMMVLEERQPELAAFLYKEGTAPLNEDEKQVLAAYNERFDKEKGASQKVVEAIKSL